MWTIATPFVDKPYSIRLWLESFKRLEFPRKDFKLLWLDMSHNPIISNLLKDYLDKHAGDFKSVEYIDNINKENIPETGAKCGTTEFQKRRKAIAETANLINKCREGNMVYFEDDVIVPPNAWNYMKEVFDWSDKFYEVGSVQYSRNPNWVNNLLIWDWEYKKVFPDNDDCDEMAWNVIVREEERERGFEFVGSVSSGFVLYRKEFLDKHNFKENINYGQDIMTGFNIAQKHNGKLMLCWEIKLPHVGLLDGKFHIFRSPMCKTEVIDDFGTSF